MDHPNIQNPQFLNVVKNNLKHRPSHKQTARAATLIQAAFRWRSNLDKERVKPLMVSGLVPLCSYQYERQFNTTRVPGIEKDQIVHIARVLTCLMF